MIKVAIFDLWNTLVIPIGPKFSTRLAKVMELDEDYVQDYIRASSSRHKEVHYLTIVREIWNYLYDTSVPSVISKKVEKEFIDFIANVKFVDNAFHCLEELKKNDIKVAIVSNSTSVSIEIVKNLGIDKLVDEVYLSCLTGYLKPDPRAFQQVTKKFEVKANEVCVVGDKITTDILGAKLAKMKTVLFAPNINYTSKVFPIDILSVINDLLLVPEVIKRENTNG